MKPPLIQRTKRSQMRMSKKSFAVEVLGKARPGMSLVMTGEVALSGTEELLRSNEKKLRETLPDTLLDRAGSFLQFISVENDIEVAVRSMVASFCEVGDGGIYRALWDMAAAAGAGVDVYLGRIPIRQETVEVCEVCGVNPYEMRSSGCLLMTARDGEALVQALESKGISACVIGRLTDGQDRMIRNEEEIRYLDRPRGGDPIWESRKD